MWPWCIYLGFAEGGVVGDGLQSTAVTSAPPARQTAIVASPATYVCVVSRSQPIAMGLTKPPRFPMELITAMCAPTIGPARRTVDALQKTGMAASTPTAPSAKPAIAMGALGANAARTNPAAAVKYAPAR